MYLLGGSSFFPLRLSLLRAIGSKDWAASVDGGGIEKDDESSTSLRASVEA
jgi:predicted secreted protein